jgi:hypothetical protein
MRSARARAAAVVIYAVGLVVIVGVANADSSFATGVVDYQQGANPTAGFTDESAAIGEPARFTPFGDFSSVVSPFSPPFLPEQIVSIGAGGSLTLSFDAPITDHPANPFGIDFIVFSNGAFIDGDFDNGLVAGAFGNDPFVVEVSTDGKNWMPVAPASSDVLFPTLGYLDTTPYASAPGFVPSDFTKPVDPAITSNDLFMLTHAEVVELYADSGGGAGFDVSATGLASVNYVRITNPGAPRSTPSVEIDAVARARPAGSLADFVSSTTFQPPGDGVVDAADLAFLLGEWGANPGSPADIVSSTTFEPPGDGVVDAADLAYLLGEWTS